LQTISDLCDALLTYELQLASQIMPVMELERRHGAACALTEIQSTPVKLLPMTDVAFAFHDMAVRLGWGCKQ